MQKMAKQFTLKDVIQRARIGKKDHNLIELLYPYPSKGVGFKVSKVNEGDNIWHEIISVKFTSHSRGEVWGIKYKDGIKQVDTPVMLERTTTRGFYRYQVADSIGKTENKLEYTSAEMERFMKD